MENGGCDKVGLGTPKRLYLQSGHQTLKAEENSRSRAAGAGREIEQYTEQLRRAGLSGRIKTSFLDRLNLTIRPCVRRLTRHTWELVKYTPELMEHLECWQRYSNGEGTIILSDRMKAWSKNWRSRFNGRENSSPESIGSALQPCLLG